MLKTTLTTALLVSASATQTQDAVKAGATIIKQSKAQFHQLQTAQKTHALSAMKDFKLANKGVSLQARGMTKSTKTSVRALRGKGGKGKGKSKSDDDKGEADEEAGDTDGDSMTRQYLQISSGFCTGDDLGFGTPFTEDYYLYHGQMANGVCENSVDMDGYPFSYKTAFVAEPFTVMEYTYTMHDCKDEYMIGSWDATAEFTFGGAATVGGGCMDGIRLQMSEESLTLPGGFVGVGDIMDVNKCVASGDLSAFDWLDMESAFIMIPSVGTFPMCMSEDDSDDDAGGDDAGGDDAGGDDASSGGSFQYDVSGCGGSPATLTTQYFSDADCSVPTTTEVEEAKSCAFDIEIFMDDLARGDGGNFYFSSDLCANVV